MIQTDKERLAISAAIALFLYAGVFATTARISFLNPGEMTDYGTLTVQVTLQRPEPRTILPPVTETPPPEVRPAPVPAPQVPRPQTPQPPVAKPEPAPIPRPQPAAAPEVIRQPSEARTPASPPQPSAAVPERTPGASVATSPRVEEAPPAPPETAVAQAVPVQTPRYFGETERVAQPPAETPSSRYFESVREDTPTDRFGESEIVYGTEQPSAGREPPTRAADQAAAKRPFVDLTPLNSAPFAGEGAAGAGNGGGSAGTGAEAGAGAVIEAATFSELMSRRMVETRYDPDLSGLRLPGGLRTLTVWVEFVIRPNGVVEQVKVEDTGDTGLNSRIGEALRRWKFEPIRQDMQQTARFPYLIEAKD